MLSITAATIGLGLVIFVPGIALAWLLQREETPWWEIAAVAPAIGLGLVFVTAETASFMRIRFDLPIFAIVVAALAVVTILFVLRRRNRSTDGRISWPERSEYESIALLGAAIAIGGVIWATALQGVEVPPSYDASHHGLFIAQIDRFGTIDADTILVSSNGDATPVSSFYPLALHSAGALVAGPAPTTIADILLVYAALFAVFVFPMGIFALTRVLIPGLPLAAGFAAFLAPMFALFPYKPYAWGGIALLVGMAMMPGVVVAASRVLTLRPRIIHSIYVALALVGLFATHSSELPLAVALALLVAATSMRSLGFADWSKRVLTNGALIGMFSLALLAPVVLPVVSGGNQRLSFDITTPAPFGVVARDLVNLTLFTGISATGLVVLAGFGSLVAVLRRTALTWLAAGAAMVGLYVATFVSSSAVATALSLPWYREPERILYNIVFWLLPFAGLALASAATWIDRRLTLTWLRAATIALIGLIVLSSSMPSILQIQRLMRAWTSFSTVEADEIAAFEYLASVTEPDETVLTDLNHDGSLWMYSFAGVSPLFLLGVPQLDSLTIPQAIVDSSASRRSLAIDLDAYRGRSDVADRLVNAGIRFVYYDETGFPESGRVLDYQSLRTDPAFVPVFERGDAHVYRIDYDVLADPEQFTLSRPVLADGGFDEGLTFWSPDSHAESWSSDPSGRSTISVHDVTGQSVLYAVRPMAGTQDRSWDGPTVSPGDSYTVAFSIRPEAGSTGQVVAGLSFFDADGEWILTEAATSGDLRSLESGVWHRFASEFESPDGAARAIPVLVAVDVDGAVVIDDFNLRIRYG